MKKKTIKRILTLAVAAAALATLPGTSVFAANTVITNGTWIGSDAAGEDAGTAVRTNHLITVTNVRTLQQILMLQHIRSSKEPIRTESLPDMLSAILQR